MSRTAGILIRIMIVALAIAFVFYRVRFEPVKVIVHAVTKGPVVSEVMGSGTLNAHTKATISPKIQGRISELLVDQNDVVTTGQILARLDDVDLRAQVGIAQANLDSARATLTRVETEEARAKAVTNQAQLEYQRTATLETSKMVATSEADKSRESLQVAQAEASRAVAAIAEARQQIAAAEKTLRYQEAKLADTVIFAPFSGMITRRDRDIGDIAVPGSSIFQLISTDEIWVSAWVDESAMSKVRSGKLARIVFRSDPQTTFSGKVVRVGREVDRETREFLVDVAADRLPEGWAIGQRAEVFISTGRKDEVVLLPRRLVGWRNAVPGVFVDEGGKARWHPLDLGMGGPDEVEVKKGLDAGDLVVSVEADSKKLQTGSRVAHAR